MRDTNIIESRAISPLLSGLLGNLGLAVLKLGVGLFGGSKLVLMDGLFSFMAGAAFLLPLQVEVLHKKTPDERHPYGLGKALFLSMTVVGFLGLVIAISMLFYSLRIMGRLDAHRVYVGAMIATCISIIANATLYRYLVDNSRGHRNTMIALSAKHNRVDIWISSFVLLLLILPALGAPYLGRAGVAAISIVVFIVGLRMVFTGFGGIMDKAPSQSVLDRIKACARKVSEVKDVADLKARYVGTLLHIDLSIAVDESISMKHADGIARNVKRQLMEKIPFTQEVKVIIT